MTIGKKVVLAALALAALGSVSRLALAQPTGATVTPAAATPVLQPPADPVAKAAFDMLDKHCARCHQAERLVSRIKPAKNFGNVLVLDELAKMPQYILPGNPDGSLIFNQLAKREMPYDAYYEQDTSVPTPTADEVKALRAWIEQIGKEQQASCEVRKFVSNTDIVAAIANDLQAQPPHRIKGMRYLTLTHLYNACTADKDLVGYAQGTVKLLNSLSRSSDVVRLETIDPAKTIIRFNIEDLGWSEDDWNSLLPQYPYRAKPDTKLFSFLEQATGTKLPYVRADWFAFGASQPPLYNSLLKLPATFQELQKQLELDTEANIKKFAVQRAGFQDSGVSQHNRLIERHQIKSGYFWTSYDFAGNKANQSLFRFPLGPGADDNSFHHDGGETIFSLPNGFQGYYLNTADGKSLNKGPTQIVRDLSRKDLAVTNGISCMGCHDQGIKKKPDAIRDSVLADRTFSKATRDAVEALYAPNDKLEAIYEDDTRRFRGAMQRAGLDPSLTVAKIEMTNALYAKYEANIDLKLAAAEFGLTVDQIKSATGSTPGAFNLVRRLEQGIVPRDQFEAEFAKLAGPLGDLEILEFEAPAAASGQVASADAAAAAGSSSGSAAAAAGSSGTGGAAAGSGTSSSKVADASAAGASAGASGSAAGSSAGANGKSASAGSAAGASGKSSASAGKVSIAKPGGDDKEATRRFDVALTSDKLTYKQNENAVFTVVSRENCSLTLINVDTAGKGTIIFPNKFQQDNKIVAGKEFRFGGDDAPFRFRLQDKGTETVVADCNASRTATRGLEADNKTVGFTDLGNFAQTLTRTIVVEAKVQQDAKLAAPKVAAPSTAPKSTAPTQPEITKAAQSDISGRTAIKIKVE